MSAASTIDSGRNVIATPQQVAQARQFADLIKELKDDSESGSKAALRFGEGGRERRVPDELARIIEHVIEVLAEGGTVTVGTIPRELTTTAAAGLLGVSRPTLMKMIRSGEIPAHKVGTHSRLLSKDVLEFRRAQREAARKAFDELREIEDLLDRGIEPE
ncbi:MAG: helix-turn-helix domain-containing protein [Actinomycetota bacterium]